MISHEHKFGFATLTMEDSVPGVVALYKSLKSNKSNHPLVCLYSELSEHSIKKLSDLGVRLKKVSNIYNPYEDRHNRFETIFNKLHCWGLVEYERVIYLDSDVLNLKNMDSLFKHPINDGGICACRCSDFFKKERAKWRKKRGMSVYEEGPAPPLTWNGGFLMLSPNEKEFDKIINQVGKLPSYDGTDQGFYVSYFGNNVTILPEEYNYSVWNFDNRIGGKERFEKQKDSLFNLHYLGGKVGWGKDTWGFKYLNEFWRTYYNIEL